MRNHCGNYSRYKTLHQLQGKLRSSQPTSSIGNFLQNILAIREDVADVSILQVQFYSAKTIGIFIYPVAEFVVIFGLYLFSWGPLHQYLLIQNRQK